MKEKVVVEAKTVNSVNSEGGNASGREGGGRGGGGVGERRRIIDEV